jgi:DNA-binding response OmpR family regulator
MSGSKKILIIDDEEDIVTYLTTFFADHGFTAIFANDGKAGVQKAISEKPDIITLDVSMPEESGVRALRDLQTNDATKNIPVIIVTGVSSDFKKFIETRKQVHAPEGYFEKPVDRDKLLQKVKELLQK